MAETSLAAPRDPQSPRHTIGEMVVDFTVSDPDAAMNTPEEVLIKARAELLPQLEAVLNAPAVSTAEASIEILEIDLGVWPADPDWYAVRDRFREALLSAINPYLRWHDDRSDVYPRPLSTDAPQVKQGSPSAPKDKGTAFQSGTSDTGDAEATKQLESIKRDKTGVVSSETVKSHSDAVRSDDPIGPHLHASVQRTADTAGGEANAHAQTASEDLQNTLAYVTRVAAFRAILLELLRQARKHTTPATQRDVVRSFERLLDHLGDGDANAPEGRPIARNTLNADAYIQEVIKTIGEEEVFLLSMVIGDRQSAGSAKREALGTALKQLVDQTFRSAKAVLPPLKDASNTQGALAHAAQETAATALQIAARDALRQHKSPRAFDETDPAATQVETGRSTDDLLPMLLSDDATQKHSVADVRGLLVPLLTAAGHTRLDAEAFLALLGFGETQARPAKAALGPQTEGSDEFRVSQSVYLSETGTEQRTAGHAQTENHDRPEVEKYSAETTVVRATHPVDQDAEESVYSEGAASGSQSASRASSDIDPKLGTADATRLGQSQQKHSDASGGEPLGRADHSSGTNNPDQVDKRFQPDALSSAVDERSADLSGLDPSGREADQRPGDLSEKTGRTSDDSAQASDAQGLLPDVSETAAVPFEDTRLSGNGRIDTTAADDPGGLSPDKLKTTTQADQHADATAAFPSASGEGRADQPEKTGASGLGASAPTRKAVAARGVGPADISSGPDATRSAEKVPPLDPQKPSDSEAGPPPASDEPPVVRPYFASRHPEAVAKRHKLFDEIAPLVLDTLTSLPGAQRQTWRHLFDVIWSALPKALEDDGPLEGTWAVGNAVETSQEEGVTNRQSTRNAADADDAPGITPLQSEQTRNDRRENAPQMAPVFKTTGQRGATSDQNALADHKGQQAKQGQESREGGTGAEPQSRAQTTGSLVEKGADTPKSEDRQYLAALAELLGVSPGPDDDFATRLDSILLRLFPQTNARHRALRHLAARLGYVDWTTSPVLRRQALAAVNEVIQRQNQTKAGSGKSAPSSSQRDDATAARAYLSQRSGLVLFATYLPLLFDRLGVLDEDRKIKAADLTRARRALQLLGDADTLEVSRTDPLEKTLLGLPQTWHFDKQPADPAPDGVLINGLIEAVIKQWAALGQTSVAGMQDAFVKRAGALRAVEEGWTLTVEQGPFDMLLDRLPWSFDTIALPWMDLPLHVTWRPKDD
ncbi:MAG: contractile injection system tape measure protein [Roseobacter sp.]